MSYEITPGIIHAVLVDVAADGESLRGSAEMATTAGDNVSGQFGTAADVSSAFSAFWASRNDVGTRIAALVLRKAGCVATAAEAFIDADGEMTDAASTALSNLPAVSGS